MRALMLFNTFLGGLIIADLVAVTGGKFTWLFLLQAILYLANILFLFVKTESRKLKVTAVFLKYLALSTILIDLIIRFSYSRGIMFVVLCVILFFTIMTAGLYFENNDSSEKISRYSRQYYIVINVLSTAFALGVFSVTAVAMRNI